MSQAPWQPTASRATLAARAQVNHQIRAFFHHRNVLEVETPLLSHAIGSDPNLEPIVANYHSHPAASAQPMFLQTSPEFAMKRLLASGSGPVFQLCKAFRNGEQGSRHNPEFTMLEWYRPDFSLEQLMDEVSALVSTVLHDLACRVLSYRELFEQQLGIDPHTASVPMLASLARVHTEVTFDSDNRDTWLDLLYGTVIEPNLQQATFVVDYPASQAALARLSSDRNGQTVARRFELVIGGMEIANGYDELVDATEQQRRFAADRARRLHRGQSCHPEDSRLLSAMNAGLPPCAGVALGVDRLLMLKTGTSDIRSVLAFAHERA